MWGVRTKAIPIVVGIKARGGIRRMKVTIGFSYSN